MQATSRCIQQHLQRPRALVGQRAFTSRRPVQCTARMARGPLALAQASHQSTQHEPSSSLAFLTAGSPLLGLLLAGAAWAEDIDSAAEQAAAAIYDQDSGSTDLVVSLLAGVVFLLLLVVTAGVAYLSLKSWLDTRQEKEDQKGGSKAPASTLAAAARSDDEEEAPKRVRVKKEKRGFGSQQ